MLKKFFIKKMLKSQLKGQNIPGDQQEKLVNMISENPELFQKIAEEAQEMMKDGKDQMTAMTEVMQKYQDDLKGLM